jgi:RHS repeat-associated protein
MAGNKILDYEYNADGLRIIKSVDGIKTSSMWDDQDIVLEVSDDYGNCPKSISKYIRGINLIAYEEVDADDLSCEGIRKYYLFNAHGDVVKLTDDLGNVVNDYSYDAFGNRELLFGDLNNDGKINLDDCLIIRDYLIGVITDFPTLDGIVKADLNGDGNIDTNDMAYLQQYYINMINVFPADNNLNGYADEDEIKVNFVDTNPFRYCGEYFDKETGTVYLRARYYNPSVGRFITEDSYHGEDNDPLSLNLYTYCYSDPINNIDPTGHFVFGIIPIIVGTAPEWVPVVTGVVTTGITAVTVHETVVKPIINEYRDSTGAYTTNKPIAVPKPNDAPKPTPRPQPKNNSAPKVVVNTQTKDDEPTFIYRLGSYTNTNLTPREKDISGLSFTTLKPTEGKYLVTTIEQVCQTGKLKAIKDGITHVSVLPVNSDTMYGWIASRPNAEALPHPYTILLKSIVIPNK